MMVETNAIPTQKACFHVATAFPHAREGDFGQRYQGRAQTRPTQALACLVRGWRGSAGGIASGQKRGGLTQSPYRPFSILGLGAVATI